MRSSFTEENFETYIKDSLGRRGGGRGMFGSYSKDISFNTVPEDQLQESDIKIEEGESAADEEL